MLVVHATWSDGWLMLWGERSRAEAQDAGAGAHPFAASEEDLAALVPEHGGAAALRLYLPFAGARPRPSPTLTHHVPSLHVPGNGDGTALQEASVPAIRVLPGRVERDLDRLLEVAASDHRLAADGSIRFFVTLARMARSLVCQQRVVPMVLQVGGMAAEGAWRPWLGDEPASSRVVALARAMPPIVRAGVGSCDQDAWAVTDEALGVITDALCREALVRDDMAGAIESRAPEEDPQVAWLTGLLDRSARIEAQEQFGPELVRRVRVWIGGLDDRGLSTAWKLRLRLEEPPNVEGLGDTEVDPGDLAWRLHFELRAADDESLIVEAEDVWLLPTDSISMGGRRLDNPRELLLAELGRASKIYKQLERALKEVQPTSLGLDTGQAYQFLREFRPLLLEQGFDVDAPPWWDQPTMRLGARLRIDSGEAGADAGPHTTDALPTRLGLEALVRFAWDISVGDHVLSEREFESLANAKAPLVRLGGRWVELRAEDLQAALRLVRQAGDGTATLGEALRMAYAAEGRQHALRVTGIEVSGWLSPLFDEAGVAERLETVETPGAFKGELRPYQLRGVSWLAFLERFGFGACLADDMGLGKTVQLLALLLHEREVGIEAKAESAGLGPTLLVVPMSVVGNWMREAQRFAPDLRVLVHHGVERALGDQLVAEVAECDLFVTTYALANRDREHLGRVHWRRIVLDEAQYVKNPQAKQSQAVRAFLAPRRIALTGTPVENRLTELWSIMDFLNPGYLGPSGTFRRRFAVPIERYHDQEKAEQLRALVRPFVLRRHKADPSIMVELPEKLETREYCLLTREQAGLYESCVSRMLKDVDAAEGMHRRGLVLSSLIKLKQICNHPAQALKDFDPESGEPPDPARSGKCVRIIEMLDEIISAGEQSLIFTQYRQMGHLLGLMLRHEFDREVLFLHGGTAQGQRVAMIDDFQGMGMTRPIMILSLKAGGVGLNLTAASHVFHFDRWWNPAVENQATDRAYRIGQDKTVQVHKFVVRGTLEERIDEMIESKTALAQSIVGAGERWLTELSTDDLRSILTLRADAVEDEG
ncbi:MAG TPA: DEAD/DEAH box helicase [Phycisphaerales bacterium]|nr:DEAD/DEAH box helicase [Phycisphaerales bacterium]